MDIIKEKLNLAFCNIEFDHDFDINVKSNTDSSFEINYKIVDTENNVIVEDFACINYLDLKETEDSKDELNIVNLQLKRALSYLIEGFNKHKSTYDIIDNTTYYLDLFSAETYNGWDLDSQVEIHNNKKQATISILLYCIIKIHFALKFK